MHHERLGEHVPQEPETGKDDAECIRLRLDVHECHFQQVTRLRASHRHRPGQGMNHAGVHAAEIRLGDAGPHLAVKGISRFQRHLFAFVNFDDGWDVGMPAVMPCVRLLAQGFAAVNRDALHGISLPGRALPVAALPDAIGGP